MYSILVAILSFPFRFMALEAFAATTGPGPQIPTTNNPPVSSVSFTGPFGSDTIETVLRRLIGYATTIGASIATLMVLYGAFQILTSRGSAEQVKAGRKTIQYALGGLVVIILAGGLVTLFSTIARNLGI